MNLYPDLSPCFWSGKCRKPQQHDGLYSYIKEDFKDLYRITVNIIITIGFQIKSIKS
jgi:hypothetical protein